MHVAIHLLKNTINFDIDCRRDKELLFEQSYKRFHK